MFAIFQHLLNWRSSSELSLRSRAEDSAEEMKNESRFGSDFALRDWSFFFSSRLIPGHGAWIRFLSTKALHSTCSPSRLQVCGFTFTRRHLKAQFYCHRRGVLAMEIRKKSFRQSDDGDEEQEGKLCLASITANLFKLFSLPGFSSHLVSQA